MEHAHIICKKAYLINHLKLCYLTTCDLNLLICRPVCPFRVTRGPASCVHPSTPPPLVRGPLVTCRWSGGEQASARRHAPRLRQHWTSPHVYRTSQMAHKAGQQCNFSRATSSVREDLTHPCCYLSSTKPAAKCDAEPLMVNFSEEGARRANSSDS